MDKFIISPIEVLMDSRLSHMQLKVLLALYSFGDAAGNLVLPADSQLAERCGYSEKKVKHAISELADLGWVRCADEKGSV